MTEPKERKKKTATGDQAQRMQQVSVGEILRRSRLEKGLGLEQVSSSINIRVAQLRALEEGNIEALPGMTYALGFVRSYANHLRLNSGEIVHKFKAEHGGSQAVKPEFHLPEPIGENRMPNPQMLVIAGVFVVLLLVLWAVFSDSDGEEAGMVAQIPPPPVVQPLSEMASAPLFVATPEVAMTETGVSAAAEVAPPIESSAMPDPQAQQQESPAPVQVTKPEEEIPAVTEALPEAAVKETIAVSPVPERRQEEKAREEVAKNQEIAVINVSRGKSRIFLQSTQPSWIQVSDAKQKILFKKVLKPGEKYFVPDEKGMTLVTSNAGGLQVYVDGAMVQSLGKTGEILRGVELDPQELKKKKIKVRD